MTMEPKVYKAVALAMATYRRTKDIEAGYQAMKYLDSNDYEEACNEFDRTVAQEWREDFEKKISQKGA